MTGDVKTFLPLSLGRLPEAARQRGKETSVKAETCPPDPACQGTDGGWSPPRSRGGSCDRKEPSPLGKPGRAQELEAPGTPEKRRGREAEHRGGVERPRQEQ